MASTLQNGTRCSAFTVMAALVLLAAVATRLPAGARASALRSPVPADDDSGHRHARDRLDVAGPVTFDAARTAAAAVAAPGAADAAPGATVRDKRSFKLLKLKPLITLPAKVALGAGSKLVTGAKLGAKAVRVGAKAVGAGLVGLKAVSKVAKVTVKAATALGIKAALLNFLFHKINQVIDFKTRLLSNLDQKNRQQNAQFLSGVLPPPLSKPVSGSVGNKDPFVPELPPQGSAVTVAVVDPQPAAVAVLTTGPSDPVDLTPGSNLIATPPPQPGFPGPVNGQPQGYGPPGPVNGQPQGFGPPGSVNGQPQGFGPPGSASGQPQGFGPPGLVTAFAATNDDGSLSSETSF